MCLCHTCQNGPCYITVASKICIKEKKKGALCLGGEKSIAQIEPELHNGRRRQSRYWGRKRQQGVEGSISWFEKCMYQLWRLF